MPAPEDIRRRASQYHPKLSTAPRSDAEPSWSNGIRALYDGVAQEPLPPEFEKLLADLAKKSSK